MGVADVRIHFPNTGKSVVGTWSKSYSDMIGEIIFGRNIGSSESLRETSFWINQYTMGSFMAICRS